MNGFQQQMNPLQNNYMVEPLVDDDRYGMIAGNQVLNAAEKKIYKMIERVVQENKNLYDILSHNRVKLQEHYDQCVDWLKGHKTQLEEEKNKCAILQKQLDGYKDMHSSNKDEKLKEELSKFYKQLVDLLKSYGVIETSEQDEDGFTIITQAVQDTEDQIKKFTSAEFLDSKLINDFCSSVSVIQGKIEGSHNSMVGDFKETFDKIQDAVRRYSLPFSGGEKQIPFETYVELKARYEKLSEDHRQCHVKAQELVDIQAEKEVLINSLEEEKIKCSNMDKKLKEKDDQIKSMEQIMNEKSVEILLPSKQNDDLKREINKLKSEIRSLEEDLTETSETFNKVEDENTLLRDNQVKLERIIAELSQTNEANTGGKQINAIELSNVISQRDATIKESNDYVISLKQQVDDLQRSLEKEKQEREDEQELKKKEISVRKERENRDAKSIENLMKKINELKQENFNLQEELSKKGEIVINQPMSIISLPEAHPFNSNLTTDIENTTSEHIVTNKDSVTEPMRLLDEYNLQLQHENNELKKINNDRSFQMERISHENEALRGDFKRLYDAFSDESVKSVDMRKNYESSQFELANYQREIRSVYEPQLRQQHQKIDKLTAELLGARDLIEQREMEIDQLKKNMRGEEETMKVQLEVFRTDFNQERAAREKLQGSLNDQREHLNEITIENHHLREQLKLSGNRGMNTFQQRHGVQHNYDYEPSNSYGVRSAGAIPKNNGLGMYGNGQEHAGSQQMFGRGNENRSDILKGTEQRNCPKCEKLCPDLDTLQIHLTTCLDEENHEASNDNN